MERRYKILQIDKEHLVNLFNAFRLPELSAPKLKFIEVPIASKLPKGYEVHSVYYEPFRDCFQVIIWHASFPIIDPGLTIPVLDGINDLMFIKLELKTKE